MCHDTFVKTAGEIAERKGLSDLMLAVIPSDIIHETSEERVRELAKNIAPGIVASVTQAKTAREA